jgi:hypothetical protein
MLVESGVLALLGGAGSLLVARLAMAGLLALLPVSDAEMLAFAVDRDILLFTGAVTMLTALIFGVAPAVHAVRAVRTGAPGTQARATSSRGMTRLRSALAGSQVALATALLALAGLLIASLSNLATVDLGVTPAGSRCSVWRRAQRVSPPQSLALFDWNERAGHARRRLGQRRDGSPSRRQQQRERHGRQRLHAGPRQRCARAIHRRGLTLFLHLGDTADGRPRVHRRRQR